LEALYDVIDVRCGYEPGLFL